jgi:hypothetical protein
LRVRRRRFCGRGPREELLPEAVRDHVERGDHEQAEHRREPAVVTVSATVDYHASVALWSVLYPAEVTGWVGLELWATNYGLVDEDTREIIRDEHHVIHGVHPFGHYARYFDDYRSTVSLSLTNEPVYPNRSYKAVVRARAYAFAAGKDHWLGGADAFLHVFASVPSITVQF